MFGEGGGEGMESADEAVCGFEIVGRYDVGR